MRRFAFTVGGSLLAVSALAFTACSADIDVFGPTGGGGTGATSGSGQQSGSTAQVSSSVSASSVSATTTTTVSSSSGMSCPQGPDDDVDADGFSPSQGDCNDCDPALSPNNVEVPGNGLDDDCSGEIDELFEACDLGLAIDDQAPALAANAIDLCKSSTGPASWGLASAAWVLADGSAVPSDPGQAQAFHLGHGLLDNFGNLYIPRFGQKMLALSNAVARDAADPDYVDPNTANGWNVTCGFPPGAPKPSDCPGAVSGTPNDPVALELVIRVPDNAHGFSFDSNFFSADWPAFVCSAYDDTFFAHLAPTPPGQPDGQIALYANGNPVSLNGAPFDVCSCMMPPCMAGGKAYPCSQGDAGLAGTGFEGNAATGWQTTTSPAPPGGEITLRLGVYDAADAVLGASALVDAFDWITTPGVVVSTVSSP